MGLILEFRQNLSDAAGAVPLRPALPTVPIPALFL
jgi:hypothetical protein